MSQDQVPQTVRCKFSCNSVVKRLENRKEKRFVYTYEFSVVYSGSEENNKYFAYTPSGQLNVGSFKDDLFEPGKEYFIDITLAVAPVSEPMPA